MNEQLLLKPIRRVDLPWGYLDVLVESEEFDVSVEVIQPGSEMSPYCYKTSREMIFILEGEGQTPEGIARAGDWFDIRPRQVFGLRNNTDQPLRFIVINIPHYSFDDVVPAGEDQSGTP